eukprot:Sspe_Gene.49993::Locus_27428_Transcript_1_1_Confidence_1.000_Length_1749::g.49993::m.49993
MGCGSSQASESETKEDRVKPKTATTFAEDVGDSPTDGALFKSKTMARMERAKSRWEGEHSHNLNMVLSKDMGSGISEVSRMDLKRRQSRINQGSSRRRSSIMGDFIASVEHFLESRDEADEETKADSLRALFNLLKDDDAETITVQNLKMGFARMEWDVSDQNLEKMFSLADGDNSGTIDFDEFAHFFRHVTADGVLADNDIGMGGKVYAPPKRREWKPGKRPLRSIRVHLFSGSVNRVKTMAIAPGRPVFAGCDRSDAVMHLYDISTGNEMRQYVGHHDTIMHVTISQDKKHMATASRDWTLKLWDLTVGILLKSFDHPGCVTCATFSNDGHHVLSGCQDNVCRKFVVKSGKLVARTETGKSKSMYYDQSQGVILSITFQPVTGDKVAITRSKDSCVLLLNAHSLILLFQLHGHKGMVWTCCFSPDGSHLVSNCERYLKVWSSDNGKCEGTVDVLSTSYATSGITPPDGTDARKGRERAGEPPTVIFLTCTYCTQSFSHVIVAARSDNQIVFVNQMTLQIIGSLLSYAPVFCISTSQHTDQAVAGDERGNFYRLDFE